MWKLGTLFILLPIFSLATARHTQVSDSPSPPPPQTTPAATMSPDNPAIPVAELAQKPELVTRLKIFLDQHSFSPWKIDGHWGDFCAKALQRYQLAHGQQTTSQVDQAIQQELAQISPLYINYQLTVEDFRHVGRVPRRPAEQARLKAMLYRSILDFVAERYHSDERFISKLNSDRNMRTLKLGDTIRVPNVTPFQIENIHPVENLSVNPALASRTIKVDARARMLDVVDGDKIIGSYPVTPGSKQLPAPIGTWKITRITLMPWFRWDKEMLNHGKRSSNFHNIHRAREIRSASPGLAWTKKELAFTGPMIRT